MPSEYQREQGKGDGEWNERRDDRSEGKMKEGRAGVRNNITGLDPRRICFLACFEISRSEMQKSYRDSGPWVFCLVFVATNPAVFCSTFGNADPEPDALWHIPDLSPPIHGAGHALHSQLSLLDFPSVFPGFWSGI